ncbi:DUF6494 family protein [Azospirillum brasilense]|uniref:Uncharacterized protein n=1 Tax=Azospirillum brasilense TaxID=192 RepID=A0A6L3AW17_AZOBR|nr:DUF6494 family protein [Azospirillum brasilense]KAA0682120.1 hypothetical protein DS837_21205 [Azospirillum brasilense]UKJ74923.1 hypothetical protein H1Q64_20605 [Azospirillum brasilense]
MDHDTFNMGIRKYLKVVGVTSQREIERAVSEAMEAGKLKGNETLQARVVLTVEGIGLEHEIKGEIALE